MRTGETTGSRWASEQALSDARRRIDGDTIHAWVALATDEQAAIWAPGHGPLEGMSVGVKDIIDLAGMPTRCGSTITSDAPRDRSASFVERVIDAGAMPVGKTVTTEFAFFAPGPTANPKAPGHTPGGSSSGSAAAVAAGHVPLALGSQTAGSLTRPAAYCGVAGLVLSHGSVALDGFSGLASSLDAAGLITATVAELDRVHDALFPSQPTATEASRVIVWEGGESHPVASEMRAAVARSAAALQRSGMHVEALRSRLPIATLASDHLTLMQYEIARERKDLFAERSRLSSELRNLLEAGARVTDEAYGNARERTEATRATFADVVGDDAVVLGPASPGAAPRGLRGTGSPAMSRPWQLLGLPQLTVPGTTDSAGFPLGVQLVTRSGQERTLLRVGRVLEHELAEV